VSLAEAEAWITDWGGPSAAGDQDGDGCSDLIVGWKVFSGPMLGELDHDADDTASLESDRDEWALFPASGDIDADGLADWVIGGEGIDDYLGGAYVVYGPAYGTMDLWSEADAILIGQGGYAGGDENRAVDLGGSTNADILLVARRYEDEGRFVSGAYLMYGPTHGMLALADSDAIVEGDPDQDLWVLSASAGGDLDGDGLNDLFVGSEYNLGAGAAHILPGPLAGVLSLSDAEATLVGEFPGSYAGRDISSGGDVDGDGYGDMLVGAPEYQDMNGRAYLVHGPVSGEHSLSEAAAVFRADGLSAEVGWTVSLEQDMDGDGRADIAVSSPGGMGAPNRGAVFLFYEPPTGTVYCFHDADAVLYSVEDDYLTNTGNVMGSAGDLNGDGYDDLFVTSMSTATGMFTEYLVFGGPR
jgi:hypothetical protein